MDYKQKTKHVSISEWIHMGNLAKRHQINIKAELGIFYTLDVQVNMLSTRHKSEPKILSFHLQRLAFRLGTVQLQYKIPQKRASHSFI